MDAFANGRNDGNPSEDSGPSTFLLSVVIPVYNEQDVLGLLLDSLCGVLDGMNCDYEILLVNDGSRDQSLEILQSEAKADPRIKVLSFSRNFGHQAGVTAGLDYADGDVVIVMDADLQDPPELLSEMVERYHQGFDVVSAQRVERDGDSWFKRLTASAFYWVMRKMVDPRIVPEVGDFRLFSRSAVQAIRRFREQHRFMRGLVAWLGLRECVIPFRRQRRAAGSTKYPLRKMLQFAWTAISSFSALPLKATMLAGMLMSSVGLLYVFYVCYAALVLRITAPGWSSLVCIQVICSGAILMAIGLVGDYVARLFDEAKERPLYVVQQAINFGPGLCEPPRTVLLDAGHPARRSDDPQQRPDVSAEDYAHDRI
jgi:glycosyltransferase involved in cell wall biosynthesis